jgi:hypothetical protein
MKNHIEGNLMDFRQIPKPSSYKFPVYRLREPVDLVKKKAEQLFGFLFFGHQKFAAILTNIDIVASFDG